MNGSIHEECGVFGVYSPVVKNVAGLVYYGLYALQHRGQESCGMVVCDDGIFYSHKDVGLVSDVFTSDAKAADGNNGCRSCKIRHNGTNRPYKLPAD